MSYFLAGASQKVSGSTFESLGVPQKVSGSVFESLGVPQKVSGSAFESLGVPQKVSGSTFEVLGTSQNIYHFPHRRRATAFFSKIVVHIVSRLYNSLKTFQKRGVKHSYNLTSGSTNHRPYES